LACTGLGVEEALEMNNVARHSIPLGVLICVGCGVPKDVKDELKALRDESAEYRKLFDAFNKKIAQGDKTLADSIVEASSKFGEGHDPIGINHLLKENDLLRKRVAELEAQAAGKPAPPPAKAIKVGQVQIVVVGINEPTAGPQNYQFKGPHVERYAHPVGKELLAAWPVIQQHHADIKGNALFWRDWVGYFGVSVQGQNIIVGGTPQDKGRFPIDIVYLYLE
jgi:hypothetical protein